MSPGGGGQKSEEGFLEEVAPGQDHLASQLRFIWKVAPRQSSTVRICDRLAMPATGLALGGWHACVRPSAVPELILGRRAGLSKGKTSHKGI